MEPIDFVPIHPLLVPGNEPPLAYALGVLFPDRGLEVYAILTEGMPPLVYDLLTTKRVAFYFPGDMCAFAKQYLGISTPLETWHIAATDPDYEALRAVEKVDWRYPRDIDMEALEGLLRGIHDVWAADAESWGGPVHPFAPGRGQEMEEVASPTEPPFFADMTKLDDETNLILTGPAPHLANQNLIAYLQQNTFSPSAEYYAAELQSRTGNMGDLSKSVIEQQMKVHDRMLKSGSTQAVCAGGIQVGTYVRYMIQRRRRKDPTPAEAMDDIRHNSTLEPDGAQTFTARAYRVVEIIPSTPTSDTQYKLRGPKRVFYRYELCPTNNIVEGSIVRIRLAANPYYRKEIERIIKSGERLFKYNHMFSRSLFKVEKAEEVEGVERFFLTVVWEAGRLYKFALWETDAKQNRWSQYHEGFAGYLNQDLLRVDQQTALQVETDPDQYTESIRAIINHTTRAKPRPLQVVVERDTPKSLEHAAAAKQVAQWLVSQGVMPVPQDEWAPFEVSVEQKEDMWLDLRKTIMSGTKLSQWATRVSTTTGGESKTVSSLLADYMGYFTGKRQRESLGRTAENNMYWGTIMEKEAMAEYAQYLNVRSPGSVPRTNIGLVIDPQFRIGASPDGWVYDDGMADEPIGAVEFKCPVGTYFKDNPKLNPRNPADLKTIMATFQIQPPAKYLEMHRLSTMDRGYYCQMLANLFLKDTIQWIDFVAWVPANGLYTFPDHMTGHPNMKVYRFNKQDPALLKDWTDLLAVLKQAHTRHIRVFTENLERFYAKWKDARA